MRNKLFPTAIHPLLRFNVLVAGALVVTFMALRLVLLFFVNQQGHQVSYELILLVIKYSWPFDVFVATYFCLLPVLFLLVGVWIKNERLNAVFINVINWYVALGIPLLLFTTIVDIPYFLFFQNRLTEATLQWFDNTTLIVEMLVGNKIYLLALVFAIALSVGSFFLVFKRGKRFLEQSSVKIKPHWSVNVLVSIAVIVLMFLGMRGRLDHPLREGDAFFSENTTFNQVCLNPIFTLVKSYEAQANLMPDEEALKQAQQFLSISTPIDSISPIARFVPAVSSSTQPNVILVLMESMSAAYMGTFGNNSGLTPNLDSLAKVSWLHTNMYSAGIHTNNGVFSTLYGFPAIKRTRPMCTVPLRRYSGLPFSLKSAGYHNLFFTSHDKSFDNLGAFIPFNGFDKLYSVEDYDKEAELGPFGVPDDYLFSFAAQKLKQQKQPFFATILTTSNHEPYIIPEAFRNKLADKSLDAVHYADWAIGQFMQQCSKQPWYKNTVFVFVSDHGLNIGKQVSGFALNYHHIPLLIHQPGKLQGKVVPQFMQQVDVYPYLMSLLQLPHINNTLGVSPTEHQRKMVYFSADDKLATLSEDWLYIYYYSGKEFLFKRSEQKCKNYINEQPIVVDEMKRYAFSQTQSAEWIFRTDKTAIK